MCLFLGEQKVSFEDALGEIRSSFIKEDLAILKKCLNEYGYLCIRNLIPQKNIIAARNIIYNKFKRKWKSVKFIYF